jgi:hypothetical protein
MVRVMSEEEPSPAFSPRRRCARAHRITAHRGGAPVARRWRADGAADAFRAIMSIATTDWNLRHTHPKGSWWQYRNDRRFGELTLLGLGIMSVISVALVVWAVLVA